MSAYSPLVARYFRRPIQESGVAIHGEAGSIAQGTWVCVTADLADGQLQNVGFRIYACPHIIAACNRAAELLEGAPVLTLQDLDIEKLQQEFEIPVEKAGKLLILKDALFNACAPLRTAQA
jgi:NifU-like protein involved in Fe-S cluster formation